MITKLQMELFQALDNDVPSRCYTCATCPGDSAAEKRVSRVSSTRQPRDVWGHVERYSGAQGPLLVTTEQRQPKVGLICLLT